MTLLEGKTDQEICQEFNNLKFRHMYSILKGRLMAYYKDLHEMQINIPFFMVEKDYERKVNSLMSEAMANGTYRQAYEQAYLDAAEFLDYGFEV